MLIMTSNAPDTMYLDKMKNYQHFLKALVGPTEILISGGLGRLAAQVLIAGSCQRCIFRR